MEPCLNGTLVRADRTNKDVSRGQRGLMGWLYADAFGLDLSDYICLFNLCCYLLAFPRTSGQAVCQRDRAAGRSAG